MAGGQQTGPPDDWNSHADSGNLWKIWSSFYYHSRACHRRDVPCYVWNDCGCGNIQPSGKCFLQLTILFNSMFNVSDGRDKKALDWSDWKWLFWYNWLWYLAVIPPSQPVICGPARKTHSVLQINRGEPAYIEDTRRDLNLTLTLHIKVPQREHRQLKIFHFLIHIYSFFCNASLFPAETRGNKSVLLWNTPVDFTTCWPLKGSNALEIIDLALQEIDNWVSGVKWKMAQKCDLSFTPSVLVSQHTWAQMMWR